MTVRTPYSEGWDAGYFGYPHEANPYWRGWARDCSLPCELSDAWLAGWRDGFHYGNQMAGEKHKANAQ